MEQSVNIRVSNHHVHLTKETYDLLFAEEMQVKNYLSQVGQFASDKVLTIRNGDKKIENVRVVGPHRPYNQIEVSKYDARKLGLNPPVKQSGDLEDSLEITLQTDKGMVTTKGLIIAGRHVHMNFEDAEKYGVENKQKVKIKIDGDKGGILDAEIKITEDGFYEAHIDTDDANCCLAEDGSIGTLII